MVPRIDVFEGKIPDFSDTEMYPPLELTWVQGVPELRYATGSGGTQMNNEGRSDVKKGVMKGDTLRLGDNLFPVGSYEDFVADYDYVRKTIFTGHTTSYAYTRLELLAAKFNLYVLLNGTRELNAQKSVPHRDFYNVRKVDTHVHHSACMTQKHLLRYIKHKLRYVPKDVVIFRDDKYLTLGEVFESLKLTAYDLSIDTLDMHAHDTFHRFDRYFYILYFTV